MDRISCDSMFLKQIIGKVVKQFIKKKTSLNIKEFKLDELDISHNDGGDIEVRLALNATITENEFKSLMERVKLI